jgi:predicted secreted protein
LTSEGSAGTVGFSAPAPTPYGTGAAEPPRSFPLDLTRNPWSKVNGELISLATPREVSMPYRLIFAWIVIFLVTAPIGARSQVTANDPAAISELRLGRAAVCETVKEGEMVNRGVVFSIILGRVYCYTDFVAVPEKTLTYHVWYQADQRRASVKLALRPPRWAVYSYITLRDGDKGPWRVEITDERGTVLQTLRFSVVD